MIKILVTGGAGFIGSHIVDRLVEKNCKVVIIDNLSSGSLDNLSQNKLIKFYNCDIVTDDYEDIFINEKPDFVVHLAAQTSVFISAENPEEDATVNIVASIRLLNICKKYNVKKFITSSSAAVYGMPQYLPIDESHPVAPISNYGLSKFTMEKYIQLSGVPYIIFRFANVYGPRQVSSKESGVVAIFNDLMLKNEPVNIYGDGEQVRDFVYVEDIANAVCRSIQENIKNEVINYSTNNGITINELFSLMKDLYDYKYPPNYMPAREGDIKDSILSNKKARCLLNLPQITSLSVGLRNLRQWGVKRDRLIGGRHG
ncbi:MAG: NAD-dependent epimerase/dehydratase family protein [Candidatus Gastranaerophilales bacterium]|nr:NAD-dependent epimerase/dehydratase family protein [Candidatus Gastranaerophilales bacterium]